eukprot:gnl/TRDRNA2_/TRDRNA2_151372_c0_seq3.p2 gnl/TRDRNA2_/TRDRNA2_151372_c0~~gnl/TRDRNA2_/TRDRNA2_151372_c0_seq3.p2  ORF type:complete len:120 (+),score=40.47 gnl/TRDRNA2_/TRDRNA2_151372_c0_seq3:66-425(+)
MAFFKLFFLFALIAVVAALKYPPHEDCEVYDREAKHDDKFPEPNEKKDDGTGDAKKRNVEFQKCLERQKKLQAAEDAAADDSAKNSRQRADAKAALKGAYKGLKEANEEKKKSEDQLKK